MRRRLCAELTSVRRIFVLGCLIVSDFSLSASVRGTVLAQEPPDNRPGHSGHGQSIQHQAKAFNTRPGNAAGEAREVLGRNDPIPPCVTFGNLT